MPKNFINKLRSIPCPLLESDFENETISPAYRDMYKEGFDYMIQATLKIWDEYKLPSLLMSHVEDMNTTKAPATAKKAVLNHVLYYAGIHAACDCLFPMITAPQAAIACPAAPNMRKPHPANPAT